MTTFDELFAEHNLTPNERKALVMHLATLRAQKTVEALQDCPIASAPSTPPHAVVEAGALTDERIAELINGCDFSTMVTADDVFYLIARAVESELRGIAPKAEQEKT